MKTYLISDEDIGRYAQDIADRLTELGTNFPFTWCLLGNSGEKITAVIVSKLNQELQDKLNIIRLNFVKGSNQVNFDDINDKEFLKGPQPILVVDSSVHSGRSMLEVVKTIESCGASSISSYTLVLKRGSEFIPSYFGLIIDDTDRALFQLDRYPTNRLFKKEPFGILRKLSEDDTKRKPCCLTSGLASLDKMTWGDLLYDKIAKGTNVYVYEKHGDICGFLSFKIVSEGVMFIDAVATNKNLQNCGVGGMLIRWAETWARSNNCHLIQLWAIENRISTYERFDFVKTTRQKLDLGGGECYFFMRRELLYNIDLDDSE